MNTSVLAEQERELPAEEARSGEQALSAASPQGELAPGTYIQGKYVVHGVLGYGGFAVVYDAEHLGLGRPVAIKVLHLHADRPLALVERFRREARVSAIVHHPNVLEVYDTGVLTDGSPYLVMERLGGETLSSAIARGPLTIAAVVEIGRQLLLGLSAIAEAGIVHRDIKPDNVMLHEPGDGTCVVKLVDFGIAKRVGIEPAARLTCHGALVGTPQYMSPEQIRGEDVDIRTDLYATGAVLYEALTGHAPHESANFSELVVAVLNARPEPVRKRRPNCPVELEQLIGMALSRDPAARPGSPREMLERLDAVAHGLELPTGTAAFRAPDREPTRARVRARQAHAVVRRLLPLRGESRKLQLTLFVLMLAAPGSVHVYGASLPDQGERAPQLASAAVSESTTLTTRSASLPAPTTQSLAPVSEGRLAPVVEPLESLRAPVEARAAGTRATPPKPRSAELRGTTAELGETREPHAATAVAPQLQEVGSAPVAAAPEVVERTTSEAPAKAAPSKRSVRAAWEQTMGAALAALVRGRLEVAKAHYQEAVRLEPREATGFRGLGLVAARLEQPREAREALARYLALAPSAPDAPMIAARIAALANK